MLLPCFVLFDCPLLETCSFLKKRRNGSWGRGDKGSWEKLRKLVGIYCLREESIFNKKEKRKEKKLTKVEPKGSWAWFDKSETRAVLRGGLRCSPYLVTLT